MHSCYQVAVTVLLSRISISTHLFFACPNITEIFDKSDVYGYKEGNTHYFCLQAKFTNDYLCSKTPASGYPPISNPDGHLFFIHPTWKSGQLPTGCGADCRLFNPLAPFKSDEPKLLTYDAGLDALQMCSDNDKITTSFSVPNKTYCNCTEDNCREGYIGFKIDTSAIASRVVRYSYSISKVLCWKSTGLYGSTEVLKGMNASVNQPGVTDCPRECDCTRCPICCLNNTDCHEQCQEPCKEMRCNNESVSDVLHITKECDEVLICKTMHKSNIYVYGPDGIFISSSLESTEHSLQLANLALNGTYQCIYNQTDYCGNVESSSTNVTITLFPSLEISVESAVIYVTVGGSITLSCYTNKPSTITWLDPHGGKVLELKDSTENKVTVENPTFGNYTCTAISEKCCGDFSTRQKVVKVIETDCEFPIAGIPFLVIVVIIIVCGAIVLYYFLRKRKSQQEKDLEFIKKFVENCGCLFNSESGFELTIEDNIKVENYIKKRKLSKHYPKIIVQTFVEEYFIINRGKIQKNIIYPLNIDDHKHGRLADEIEDILRDKNYQIQKINYIWDAFQHYMKKE